MELKVLAPPGRPLSPSPPTKLNVPSSFTLFPPFPPLLTPITTRKHRTEREIFVKCYASRWSSLIEKYRMPGI